MTSVNTNIGAINAAFNMNKNSKAMTDAMARLSSGRRVNTAADDSAGVSIAQTMEAQIRGLSQSIRNADDAQNLIDTVEGAQIELVSVLQRLRELAVQAGNSSLSSVDRQAIQDEVTALVSEVDQISSNTNFNGVKLLDGSNDTITFQTGINASDSLKVDLQNSSSSAIGLEGSQGVAKLTSERITLSNTSTIAVSDVKINGENFLSATLATIASSTEGAGAIADAINLQTDVHGAFATAFNEVDAKVQGTFSMTGTFTVNGETIAMSNSRAELVDNINLLADGVQARLNGDDSFTLFNNDGGQIVIAGTAANSLSVGLTNGTYEGFVALENLDGSAVSIEAGNKANGYGSSAAGTMADLAAFGFNQTSSDGKSIEGAIVTTAALVATDEVTINDVKIGASTLDSAASKAEAINALTSEHGVTATATTTVFLDLDFSKAATDTSFEINGTAITIADDDNINDVAAIINTITSAYFRFLFKNSGFTRPILVK